MPGPSKSASNKSRNRDSLSVSGVFLVSISTARFQSSFIKASGARALGGAAGEPAAISSNSVVRRKRRVNTAGPFGSYNRRLVSDIGASLGDRARRERAPPAVAKLPIDVIDIPNEHCILNRDPKHAE